jgi:hypothetical protein
MWSVKILATLNAQVGITKIIGNDDDDVGFVRCKREIARYDQ